MLIGVRALLALALLSAVTGAASAQGNDEMAEYYGNTLISRDGGYVSHFYYKADHTFSGRVPAYMFEFQGTWQQMPDGTICRVFDPPLPRVKNPDCGPLLVHHLGDNENEPNGDTEKLVPGIQ